MTATVLGATARWIAAVRAHESRRDDRLYEDPWAAALAGSAGEAWCAQRADSPALQIIAIRVRFFDDFLQRATVDHGLRQVVLMGAGLDTRAFRLSWPAGTRLFEADRPDVLQEKEAILLAAGARPTCERRIVAADLAQPWEDVLIDSGFDRCQPACWLLEGFLFYLPDDTTLDILAGITRLSQPGSVLAFDVMNSVTLTHPWTKPWIEMQARFGAPFIGTMDDPGAVLGPGAWSTALVQAGGEEANYGRWPHPVIPLEVAGVPRHWFVTAEKRASIGTI